MKIWMAVLVGVVAATVGFGYWALQPQAAIGSVIVPFDIEKIRQSAGEEKQLFPQ